MPAPRNPAHEHAGITVRVRLRNPTLARRLRAHARQQSVTVQQLCEEVLSRCVELNLTLTCMHPTEADRFPEQWGLE